MLRAFDRLCARWYPALLMGTGLVLLVTTWVM